MTSPSTPSTEEQHAAGARLLLATQEALLGRVTPTTFAVAYYLAKRCILRALAGGEPEVVSSALHLSCALRCDRATVRRALASLTHLGLFVSAPVAYRQTRFTLTDPTTWRMEDADVEEIEEEVDRLLGARGGTQVTIVHIEQMNGGQVVVAPSQDAYCGKTSNRMGGNCGKTSNEPTEEESYCWKTRNSDSTTGGEATDQPHARGVLTTIVSPDGETMENPYGILPPPPTEDSVPSSRTPTSSSPVGLNHDGEDRGYTKRAREEQAVSPPSSESKPAASKPSNQSSKPQMDPQHPRHPDNQRLTLFDRWMIWFERQHREGGGEQVLDWLLILGRDTIGLEQTHHRRKQLVDLCNELVDGQPRGVTQVARYLLIAAGESINGDKIQFVRGIARRREQPARQNGSYGRGMSDYDEQARRNQEAWARAKANSPQGSTHDIGAATEAYRNKKIREYEEEQQRKAAYNAKLAETFDRLSRGESPVDPTL